MHTLALFAAIASASFISAWLLTLYSEWLIDNPAPRKDVKCQAESKAR